MFLLEDLTKDRGLFRHIDFEDYVPVALCDAHVCILVY